MCRNATLQAGSPQVDWRLPSEASRPWDRTEDQRRLLTFYSDHYEVELPQDHRYPMQKYERVHRLLRDAAETAPLINFQPAPLASSEELGLAHDPSYLHRCFEGELSHKEQRTVGLPWTPSLTTYARASAGGGLAATRAILQYDLPMATSLAGGTHHAFADRGEGFCLFNDIAVSARAAITEFGLQRVLVIDLDVHQGNGTAAIFKEDSRVTTFDMHGEKNYPWKTRECCTYDVGLPDDTSDDAYMEVLQGWLPRLLDRHEPQLVIFQAGVDALKADSFGRLALTRQGLLRRNNAVYSWALNAFIPLVVVFGGGYSRPMDASVDAHADVYRTAALRISAPRDR